MNVGLIGRAGVGKSTQRQQPETPERAKQAMNRLHGSDLLTCNRSGYLRVLTVSHTLPRQSEPLASPEMNAKESTTEPAGYRSA